MTSTDIDHDHCPACGKALSHLTAPPPPDEIAGLIERLDNPLWVYDSERGDTDKQLHENQSLADMKRAAAALRALAQENERLHERLEDNHEFQLIDGYMTRVEVKPGSIPDGIECRDETIKLQDERIRELEAERDAFSKKWAAALIERDTLQHEKKAAKAERDWLAKRSNNLQALANTFARERDAWCHQSELQCRAREAEVSAIRAKTIEECAQKVKEVSRKYVVTDDPISSAACLVAVKAIRALAQTDEG